MAEKITVVQLDIDEQAFIESAKLTKKSIDELVISQKKLTAAKKTSSEQYIKNDAQLKGLRSEYTQQKNAINAMQSPYAKLSKSLQLARTQAKDLAVQYGINSKQARAAATSVSKLDTQLKKIDSSVGQNQRSVGKYSNALKGISASFLGVTAVIYGTIRVLKDLFNRVVEFDKTMTDLGAILGVARDGVKDLGLEIVEVAGSSIKTSNEVAKLASTLITLGKTKSEVIDLLEPVNNLSIALGATSQEAGELLVQTLNAFGEGSDAAGDYADIIAKMRTSTALDFERIKNSLGYLAPVAKAVGLSFENTGAILGTLVDSGIKAERAGRLMSTSFIKLGAAGITLDEALEQINNSEDKLVTSSKLLGKQSAALGLILADNKDKTSDLTKEFENANGALKDLTDKQLESLDAKLKILDSTWEKLILTIENGTNGTSSFIKSTIEGLTGMLEHLNNIVTVSDGFFDNWINGFKLYTSAGRESLKVEAESIRLNEKKLILAEQLANAMEKEQQSIGGTVDKAALIEIYRNQDIDYLKEQIRLIDVKALATKNALKSEEEAEALRAKLIEENKKKSAEQQALDAEKEKERKEKIKADLVTFEKEKKELLNSIELANATSDEEKEQIKLEQSYEKQLDELELLQLNEEQKTELLALMETERQQLLNTIIEEANASAYEQVLENNKKLIDANTKLTDSDENTAQKRANIASTLTGVLTGLLGDSLGAKLASIAIEAGIQAGLVKIEGAAASGKITAGVLAANAAAIAASPLTGGLPFTAINTAQGVSLQAANAASTASAITGILTGAALKGVGTLATSAFYDGGQIGGEANIPVSMRNSGGDDVLIQAKRGEVILNESQQAKAGGAAFFNSIGVPGFATGGIVDTPTITQPLTQNSTNSQEINALFQESIKKVTIVASAEEITDTQATTVDIIAGASI